MVSQASVSGKSNSHQRPQNGTMTRSSESLRQQLISFVHDVWALAALHGQLFAADCRAAAARMASPLAFIVVSLLVLAGALPLVVVGICLLAADWLQLSIAPVLLTAAGILCVLAAIGCIVASRQLRAAFREFDRTRAELNDNAEWLKDTFEQSS